MEEEGSKRVELIEKEDKRQITVLFAGLVVGDLLPPQVIYQGKSTRCLPTYKFPENWSVIYTPNHWSNEKIMEEYIKPVIILCFENKRQKLKLEAVKRDLVLFDNFNGQCTDGIFQLLEEHHINSVIIPVNHRSLTAVGFELQQSCQNILCSNFRCGLPKKLLCKRMVKSQENLWTYGLVT